MLEKTGLISKPCNRIIMSQGWKKSYKLHKLQNEKKNLHLVPELFRKDFSSVARKKIVVISYAKTHNIHQTYKWIHIWGCISYGIVYNWHCIYDIVYICIYDIVTNDGSSAGLLSAVHLACCLTLLKCPLIGKSMMPLMISNVHTETRHY